LIENRFDGWDRRYHDVNSKTALKDVPKAYQKQFARADEDEKVKLSKKIDEKRR
jgi:hypothetical protein